MDFLTPELFNSLVWAVILIGGSLAILRLLRDLTGPPRWSDDSSGPPGPNEQPPPKRETPADDVARDAAADAAAEETH